MNATRLLESCIELSAERGLAEMREAFAYEMAQLIGATRLLLLGLDGERQYFAPLASWPAGYSTPEFPVFDSQREQHPIALAIAARETWVEEPNEFLMARLRLLLFPDMSSSRLVVVPASVKSGDFPELLFLGVIPADRDIDTPTREAAYLFGRFCMRHSLLAAKLQQASAASAALSRSLQHADKDRSQMRRSIPDALSGRLAGRSRPMQIVREQIAKFGPTNLSVLVTGETGTGKELAARELHRLSDRSNGPFVAVNVAALPEGLVESEFLGHVRGAFTGADKARAGHFAAADGGTLFLDEIGDMPALLQAKLLRVLQEKSFRPVGSDKEQSSDFRIIAATHRDIQQMVRNERFREDLYYRLGEAKLRLPPLRERGDDIVVLAEHFLQAIAEREDQPAKMLTDHAKRRLMGQPFPGNVRELQSLIARAAVDAGIEAEIDIEHLWPDDGAAVSMASTLRDDAHSLAPETLPTDLHLACAEFERDILIRAYDIADGNRARMAKNLGVPPRTLTDKLRKYQITGDYQE